MSQNCPVNLNCWSISTLELQQEWKINTKLNCGALLVYGPFLKQKSMFYYKGSGKGKPFMDYVLVVTVTGLWWKTGRSSINRPNTWDKLHFFITDRKNPKLLSSKADFSFVSYAGQMKYTYYIYWGFPWQQKKIIAFVLPYIKRLRHMQQSAQFVCKTRAVVNISASGWEGTFRLPRLPDLRPQMRQTI